MTGPAPVPQLREEFDTDTAGWSFAAVEGADASAVDPKFGAGCALVNSADGFRLIWAASQLAISDVRHFMLGMWIREDAPIPSSFDPNQRIIGAILGTVGASLLARPSDSKYRWVFGSAGLGTIFALPAATWQFVEARASYDPDTDSWDYATRLHGVDQDTYNQPATGVPESVTAVFSSWDMGSTPGWVAGLDRLWFWAGTASDPAPGWWSDVNGWDGALDLAVLAASVGPEPVTGRFGALNSPTGDLMYLVAGESSSPVTVTIDANVELDAQVIEVGFAPRSGAPLDWVTATWGGDPGTSRTAVADVGTAETYDPDPGIFELWGRLDSGAPFRIDGEVVVVP